MPVMTDDLIAALESQERELELSRFDNADAWRLGSLLVELATGRGLPVAIDIRRGAQQLFHAGLAGSVADNDRWIERKVRVVERYGASSFLVGRRLAAKGQELDAGMGVNPADYAAHGLIGDGPAHEAGAAQDQQSHAHDPAPAPGRTGRLSRYERNARNASTTSAWSSAWGRPDTVTTPTTPTSRIRIGNAPPCAA